MKPQASKASARIDRDHVAKIDAIARVEGATFSEVVRLAIEGYIAKCRDDQEFKARLKKRLEEEREFLERFAG